MSTRPCPGCGALVLGICERCKGKPPAGPLEAVSGGIQEGLEASAAPPLCPGCDCVRGQCDCEGCPKGPEPHEVGTLPWTHLLCGVCETDLYGEDGILVLSEVADCTKCKPLRDRLASEQPARPAPPSPDSPSQGERKQQLLDQDRAPSARPHTVDAFGDLDFGPICRRCPECGGQGWPTAHDQCGTCHGDPLPAQEQPAAGPSSPSSASLESGGGTLDTNGAANRKTSNPEER